MYNFIKGGGKVKRVQIFLPEQVIKQLERAKKEKGISKAEIIRRALEKYFEEEGKK